MQGMSIFFSLNPAEESEAVDKPTNNICQLTAGDLTGDKEAKDKIEVLRYIGCSSEKAQHASKQLEHLTQDDQLRSCLPRRKLLPIYLSQRRHRRCVFSYMIGKLHRPNPMRFPFRKAYPTDAPSSCATRTIILYPWDVLHLWKRIRLTNSAGDTSNHRKHTSHICGRGSSPNFLETLADTSCETNRRSDFTGADLLPIERKWGCQISTDSSLSLQSGIGVTLQNAFQP